MSETDDRPLTLLRSAAGSTPTVTQYQAFQALGCRVVGVDCDPDSVGFRFADAAHVVPRVGAPDYLERMLEVCRQERVDLFLPALDEELLICGEHREAFAALGTRVLVSGPRALQVCSDKLLMYRFFRETAVATARTLAAEDYHEGAFQRFPVIVKPRSGRGGTGVHVARCHRDAAFFCQYVDRAVVQQGLAGVEYTIDVLAGLDSRVRILSPRQRLATESGISSKGVTHWREDLLAPVQAMASALALVGPINFQCFVDAGQVTFTEINARLAGTAILSQAAGVPLFEGILDLARDRCPEPWLRPCEPVLMFRYWKELFCRAEGGQP